MRKIISFMHISLDGFVAGPNGEMDWIKVNEDIFDHVGKRISASDTALYGRVTYDMMEGYWPAAADQPNASKHDIEHSKWYSTVHKIVISKKMKGVDRENTTIISDHLGENIQKMKQPVEGKSNEILLFGSPSATHALMELNAIDGFWLFVNPIVLGKGIPLFKNINDKIKLNLLDIKQFDCGVTAVSYVIDR